MPNYQAIKEALHSWGWPLCGAGRAGFKGGLGGGLGGGAGFKGGRKLKRKGRGGHQNVVGLLGGQAGGGQGGQPGVEAIPGQGGQRGGRKDWGLIMVDLISIWVG